MNLKITNNDCKICRLSNKKVKNILSISNHDNYSGLRLEFKQKLDIHGGIEIEENDGLPNKICVECVAKMIIDYGIWKQSRVSLTLLQDYYSSIAEKNFNCTTSQIKRSRTGDFLGIEITNSNRKRLYDLESLPWLKESIALRISQLNKNYSEHGVCDKKVNNISESKAEDKQKSFNTTNLDTKKLITNEHLSETLNSSCTTKKQSFESVLNSDVCKGQEKLPKNSVKIIYVPINNGNENKDINIDNNSNQFIIIKATNKVITSLREYRIEEYISYIIENDHCYTSLARSEVKKSPKESQPIVLNDLDSRNMLEESIESTNIHGKKCYVCGKAYIRKSAFYKHMKDHKKSFREKGFECQICEKKLESNKSLKRHSITHQEEKLYKCKYCSRGFFTESKWTYHERSHTLERPYVCNLCDAKFPQMHLLKLHVTKHTGENKYLCEICGKSFRMYKCFREHQFTHTKEKPFICSNNCGMAYSNSGSLFAHKKRCFTKAQPLIA